MPHWSLYKVNQSAMFPILGWLYPILHSRRSCLDSPSPSHPIPHWRWVVPPHPSLQGVSPGWSLPWMLSLVSSAISRMSRACCKLPARRATRPSCVWAMAVPMCLGPGDETAYSIPHLAPHTSSEVCPVPMMVVLISTELSSSSLALSSSPRSQ